MRFTDLLTNYLLVVAITAAQRLLSFLKVMRTMEDDYFHLWYEKYREYTHAFSPAKAIAAIKEPKTVPRVKRTRTDIIRSIAIVVFAIAAIVFLCEYVINLVPTVYEWATTDADPEITNCRLFAIIVPFIVMVGLAILLNRWELRNAYKNHEDMSKYTIDQIDVSRWWNLEQWRRLLDSAEKQASRLKAQRKEFVHACFTLAIAVFVTIVMGRLINGGFDLSGSIEVTGSVAGSVEITNTSMMTPSTIGLSILCVIAAISCPAIGYFIWFVYSWCKGRPISKYEIFITCLSFKVADLENDTNLVLQLP